MKKFLIELLILIVASALLWLFAGRQISGLVDRFRAAEIESTPALIIGYRGSGDGGTLILGPQLSLAPLNPHVGSTKDNQLAIAYAGNLFAFGTARSADSDVLVAAISKPDVAELKKRRSYVPWLSFDSDAKPHLNRRDYYELSAKKSDGAKLDMVWSINPDAAEEERTSLIRVEISNPAK